MTTKRPNRPLDPAKRSIRGILVHMAQANGGLVVTKVATPALVDAGVYASKGDANKGLFTTLAKAQDFKREEPGVWRYVGDPQETFL